MYRALQLFFSRPSSTLTGPKARLLHRVVATLTWLYLLLIIATTLVMRFAGERWWPATLLLFCRRSYCLWPLVILVPAALFAGRRAWWIVAAAAFIAVMFLMDLCLPWRRALVHRQPQIRVRVLTLNVHGNDVTADALGRFVNQTNPDILLLQDAEGRKLNSSLRWGAWNIIYDGNSMFALASRFPIRPTGTIESPLWQFRYAAAQYEVDTGHGKLQVFNVHLESPHEAFNSAAAGADDGAALVRANSTLRLMQANRLADKARTFADPLIMAGDFDTTTDSRIWRQAFGDFTDAFAAGGFGFGWTYDHGPSRARIDHIVLGDGWECRACWVGPNLGSSHRPVIADVQRTKP